MTTRGPVALTHTTCMVSPAGGPRDSPDSGLPTVRRVSGIAWERYYPAMPGTVVSITVTDKDGEPLRALSEAELVAGKGIVGDRYYGRDDKTGRQITLVEAEQIERFNADTGLNIDPTQTRRNIVIRGMSLNDLVGVEFTVGGARIRGDRYCQPCKYLGDLLVATTGTALTAAEIVAGLHDRAGLRAEIIAGGTVRVGDPITVPASV